MVSIAKAQQIILAAGNNMDIQLLDLNFEMGPLTP